MPATFAQIFINRHGHPSHYRLITDSTDKAHCRNVNKSSYACVRGASLRGELSQRGFHPVHAADDGVHARRIREPNMRGASERFAGHKGHFRFLEQVGRHVRGCLHFSPRMGSAEETGDIWESIKSSRRHATGHAGHRI